LLLLVGFFGEVVLLLIEAFTAAVLPLAGVVLLIGVLLLLVVLVSRPIFESVLFLVELEVFLAADELVLLLAVGFF
jgi:hypothetical protein